MALHDVADVAQIIGGIALFVSVFLLILELRVNNRLVRAANTQALVSLSSPFNLALIQDRKIAEFYARGASHLMEMDEVDKYRYKALLIWWLIFHENVFFQWREGLLANHSYQAWANEFKQFVLQQKLWLQWADMKNSFEKTFVVHVEKLIQDCQRDNQAWPAAAPHLTTSTGIAYVKADRD